MQQGIFFLFCFRCSGSTINCHTGIKNAAWSTSWKLIISSSLTSMGTSPLRWDIAPACYHQLLLGRCWSQRAGAAATAGDLHCRWHSCLDSWTESSSAEIDKGAFLSQPPTPVSAAVRKPERWHQAGALQLGGSARAAQQWCNLHDGGASGHKLMHSSTSRPAWGWV